MPRGSKLCQYCNFANGPRSWACANCGKGFVIKGERKPDVPVQPSKSPISTDQTKQRLWSLVERYNGVDDRQLRAKYDIAGRTWQSLCGRYRIREHKTFMGVDMAKHYSRCVYLMKRSADGWDMVRPKGRFRTVSAAIRRMIIDQEGGKPKATTQKEKTEVQIAKRLNRKTNYS